MAYMDNITSLFFINAVMQTLLYHQMEFTVLQGKEEIFVFL
jgi:hypothetical protein